MYDSRILSKCFENNPVSIQCTHTYRSKALHGKTISQYDSQWVGPRAETIHYSFDFVRFVLLGLELDSFSVFSVWSISIFSHTYAISL